MSDPPELPQELTDRVAFLLRLALNRAETMGEHALADLGLSGREYGVLALLQHRTPPAQHHLGAALGVDRTTTVALLAALEARGLIARELDPANRRARRVTLTEAGDELRARAADLLTDCDNRFLAPLSTEERSQILTILRRLI